jgi:hypothetical protein
MNLLTIIGFLLALSMLFIDNRDTSAVLFIISSIYLAGGFIVSEIRLLRS